MSGATQANNAAYLAACRRFLADENPFVTLEVPGDNGPEYTVWYDIPRPGEEREMLDRLCFNRVALFALRVKEFDLYLSGWAWHLLAQNEVAMALLVLKLRTAFRSQWAGNWEGPLKPPLTPPAGP